MYFLIQHHSVCIIFFLKIYQLIVYLPINLYLLICLPIHQVFIRWLARKFDRNFSISLYSFLFIYLSVYRSFYMFICLINLSIYLSVYLYIYLSICLFIYLSVYPPSGGWQGADHPWRVEQPVPAGGGAGEATAADQHQEEDQQALL